MCVQCDSTHDPHFLLIRLHTRNTNFNKSRDCRYDSLLSLNIHGVWSCVDQQIRFIADSYSAFCRRIDIVQHSTECIPAGAK